MKAPKKTFNSLEMDQNSSPLRSIDRPGTLYIDLLTQRQEREQSQI